MEADIEFNVKVLIVGNGAVGKSSMIQRYCKGEFTQDYKKTIGVDFLEKKIKVEGEDLRMMIWDTAGQEEFDSLTKTYYRGAHACVVAFSTTDRASFEAVESWIQKVENEVGNIPMVLIQNKVDLIDKAVMTGEEANALAEKVKLKFYRMSVQEDYNVNEVFAYLAGLYVKRQREAEKQEAGLAAKKIGNVGPRPPGAPGNPRGAQNTIKIEHPTKQRGAKKKSPFDFCSIL